MSKHTPAPWKVVHRENDDTWEIVNTGVLADVYGEANARLIAAAPDMWNVLNGLIWAVNYGTSDPADHPVDYWIEQAQTIISKTAGEA